MSKYVSIFQKNNHIPYGECVDIYAYDGEVEIEMEYYEDQPYRCYGISMVLTREELETMATNIMNYLNESK